MIKTDVVDIIVDGHGILVHKAKIGHYPAAVGGEDLIIKDDEMRVVEALRSGENVVGNLTALVGDIELDVHLTVNVEIHIFLIPLVAVDMIFIVKIFKIFIEIGASVSVFYAV